jgi:K+-transporting ATPase KdpF subunit
MFATTADDVAGLAIAVLLVVYLVYVLISPEKF